MLLSLIMDESWWFAIQLTRQDDRTTGLGHRLARCRTRAAKSCLLSSTWLRANATCYGWNYHSTIFGNGKLHRKLHRKLIFVDHGWMMCGMSSKSLGRTFQTPSHRAVCLWLLKESVRKSLRETERDREARALVSVRKRIVNGDCFRARGRWLCTSCYRYVGGAEHRGAENRWRQNHGPGLSQADGLYRREGRQVLVPISLSLSLSLPSFFLFLLLISIVLSRLRKKVS